MNNKLFGRRMRGSCGRKRRFDGSGQGIGNYQKRNKE